VWYGSRPKAGKGASGPRDVHGAQHTWCGMPVLAPARCPSRLRAWKGEGDVVKKSRARLDAWAEAQKRFHLSDLPLQMARELGLHPKQCGGLANHRQEPWKLPLPEGIAECYRARFHRERPVKVVPLAAVAKRQQPSARDMTRPPRPSTDVSSRGSSSRDARSMERRRRRRCRSRWVSSCSTGPRRLSTKQSDGLVSLKLPYGHCQAIIASPVYDAPMTPALGERS